MYLAPCLCIFFLNAFLSHRVKQFLQGEDALTVLGILEPQAVPNLDPAA